ncbi:MAG: FadR family transcriptional regulator [Actinomycetales bacterium]|jgi:GntR family transcriptional repressor for pyruvate dehydrogenase complex|uniref:FadR family transcriptional regulator n=1 Tax=Candidatus Phosphoribacter hodrii TaxID=2953743 RepID=A0A935IGS5_9MICO|nr:FadR family transcriptional regulator [Candidatus Phosphoribacter hodrii]HNV13037.1 FCD domain-containing protein [Dermatophilaceae bacterium]MBK7271784.1 FadR family transcriptional regulator [Candidatus Phosphoribacter hodrii]HOA02466.1 FCD domain-containing protein [Dermatophilaceae bacterium]HPV79081.1 FCD domain-containing protein [Dermatophilaceae bacterium]
MTKSDGPRVTDPAHRDGMRAFEVVLAWVESRILAGELCVGDQLPPERELAKQLEVSRAAVREAVRTLQAQGVVRSAVGAGGTGGTTVTAVPAHALTRLLRLHVALANFAVDDVIEARIAMERLSIRLACRNARASDLAEMRRAIAVMDDPEIDKSRFNDADTALHLAIAEAAGNRLAADFTGAIRESIRGPLLDAIRDVAGWEDLIETLRADHRRLYAAIERRDADAAESLVEDHIRSAWRQLRPGVPAPMVASEVRARR